VLDAVVAGGPASRADLCKALPLDMALVMRRLEDALVLGLLVEEDGVLSLPPAPQSELE